MSHLGGSVHLCPDNALRPIWDSALAYSLANALPARAHAIETGRIARFVARKGNGVGRGLKRRGGDATDI